VIARIRKALIAGLGAGVAAYTNGMLDGAMTTQDWITVVGSVIVIGALTYAVPNRTTPTPPAGVSGRYVDQ
jgi:hypothetical protein